MAKSGTSKSTKSSTLKGRTPPQLKKNLKWVEYTLKNAIENGWEAFTVTQSHKDKESGEKSVEEIDMPAAVQNADGAWVYDGSISEKSPLGRQIIQKEAMSLSKIRKDSNHPSWVAFESSYVEEAETASVASAPSTASKSVVRKTAAEKLAEAEAKKAAKEAEKLAKKEERERASAEKKAAKEAEKAAAKAEKEAMKAAAKAAKVAPTKAKAPVKPASPAKPAAPVKPAAAVKSAAPKVAAPAIPDDGMVHAWTWKGKKYLRNFAGETWVAKEDGSMGAWCGVYDPASDKIDDSVEEPVFEDEE